MTLIHYIEYSDCGFGQGSMTHLIFFIEMADKLIDLNLSGTFAMLDRDSIDKLFIAFEKNKSLKTLDIASKLSVISQDDFNFMS